MADNQYLLELTNAERQSNEIIRQAQEQRDKRLKEAKFDAEQELGQIRAQHEAEIRDASVKSRDGDSEIRQMQEESRVKAQGVRSVFERSKGEVLEMLVEAVFKVSLVVPEVVQKKFDRLRA